MAQRGSKRQARIALQPLTGARQMLPLAGYSLTVRLFGGLQVWRGRRLVNAAQWRTEKNRALLALLVTSRGESFTHEELLGQLWPDPERRGHQASLRRRISELRQLLEPSRKRSHRSNYILTYPGGYCFSLLADCWVDVEAFAAKRAEGEKLEQLGAWALAADAYQEAAQLYRTGYLPEYRYAQWALPHRDRLEAAYSDLMARLAECANRLGDRQRAIDCYRGALRLEPCNEGFLRTLMELYVLEGEPAMALLAYEHYEDQLKERLGIPPAVELRELANHIRGTAVQRSSR